MSLRVKEYAELRGVSGSTVRRWCSRGKIRCHKVKGGVDEKGKRFRGFWLIDEGQAGAVKEQTPAPAQEEEVIFPLENNTTPEKVEADLCEVKKAQREKPVEISGKTGEIMPTVVLWGAVILAVMKARKG